MLLQWSCISLVIVDVVCWAAPSIEVLLVDGKVMFLSPSSCLWDVAPLLGDSSFSPPLLDCFFSFVAGRFFPEECDFLTFAITYKTVSGGRSTKQTVMDLAGKDNSANLDGFTTHVYFATLVSGADGRKACRTGLFGHRGKPTTPIATFQTFLRFHHLRS